MHRSLCSLTSVLAPLAAATLISACEPSDAADTTDQREVVLEGMLTHTILPEFQAFASATSTLHAAATSLCSDPTAAELDAAKSAWRDAHRTWRALETYRFGPMVDYPERLGSNIDFGPLRVESVQGVLAEGAAITPESLALGGAAVRGLPAIEWLLFANTDELPVAARTCEYLSAATTDLQTLADRLAARWNDEFSAEFTPPWDGMYMSPQEALAEIVNRIGFTIENTRIETLDEPIINGNEVDASLIDAPLARNATTGIAESFRTLERLIHGDPDIEDDGVDHLLRIRRRGDLVDAFDQALNACRSSLQTVGDDLESAMRDAPQTVEQLQDDLFTLQQIVQADIIGSLGLSLGFNDSDGD